MTQEKKVQIWKNLQGMFLFLFFSHPLSAFRGFPGAVPVSIASVDLIISLMYSILCSEALLQRCLFFFFWQPVAGLTNWVLVQDSQAGAPLAKVLIANNVTTTQMVHISQSCTAHDSWTNLEVVHDAKSHQTTIGIIRNLYHTVSFVPVPKKATIYQTT